MGDDEGKAVEAGKDMSVGMKREVGEGEAAEGARREDEEGGFRNILG